MDDKKKNEEVVSNIRRIEGFVREIEENEDSCYNPSKLFRNEYYVGENQDLSNIVFHDGGRTKSFRELPESRNELIDAYFETIVSDPVTEDKVLIDFMSNIKKNYEVFNSLNYRNREEMHSGVRKTVEGIIREVSEFFGGLYFRKVDAECERRIEELKRRNRRNIVFLGELKGSGVCRHRSILFKVCCDTLKIKCRILRGNISGNSYPHMWNEVIIGNETITVDTMRSLTIISGSEVERLQYRNLGHPVQESKKENELVYHIDQNYDRIRKKRIGAGGYGDAFALGGVKFRSSSGLLCDLAVKEVNVDRCSVQLKTPVEKIVKIIRKEVEMLKLLKHRNVARIFGSFSSLQGTDTVFHIVMKQYDFSGEEFERKLIGMEDYRKRIEVLVYLTEVTKGLLWIHSFGIIHYDIKPGNILVSWDEEAKRVNRVVITDFGSAKSEGMNLNLTSLPATTRKYTAPEILNAGRGKGRGKGGGRGGGMDIVTFSAKSDVYSLGVMGTEFREFYEGHSRLVKSMMQCQEEDPTKRPSLWEIMYHLRSSLEYEKRLLYIKATKTRREQASSFRVPLTSDVSERERDMEKKNKQLMEEISILRRRNEELARKLKNSDEGKVGKSFHDTDDRRTRKNGSSKKQRMKFPPEPLPVSYLSGIEGLEERYGDRLNPEAKLEERLEKIRLIKELYQRKKIEIGERERLGLDVSEEEKGLKKSVSLIRDLNRVLLGHQVGVDLKKKELKDSSNYEGSHKGDDMDEYKQLFAKKGWVRKSQTYFFLDRRGIKRHYIQKVEKSRLYTPIVKKGGEILTVQRSSDCSKWVFATQDEGISKGTSGWAPFSCFY